MQNRPLIFLHGALGDASMFTDKFDATALQAHWHIPDFPGHGRSADLPFPESMEALSNWLEVYMDEQHLVQPDILGYSMGGYVALQLAARKPGCLGTIVTLGTKLLWDETIAATESRRLDPIKISEKVPEFAAQLQARHGSAWEQVVRGTADLLGSLGRKPLRGEDFQKITHAVKMFRGELDTMVTDQECLDTIAHIPVSAYTVLPGVPHPLEQVQPATISALLAHFK